MARDAARADGRAAANFDSPGVHHVTMTSQPQGTEPDASQDPPSVSSPGLGADDSNGPERKTDTSDAGLINDVVNADAVPADLPKRIKTLLIGRPRALSDRQVFSHVALIAFLAWVGL